MGDTPMYLVCPVARANPVNRSGGSGRNAWSYPPGHVLRCRTGRTRPSAAAAAGRLRRRSLDSAHEYRCGCGHIGWTTHQDVLLLPIEGRP